MEVPLDRWMVYFVEHPHLKWMIWYHHFGNPHMFTSGGSLWEAKKLPLSHPHEMA